MNLVELQEAPSSNLEKPILDQFTDWAARIAQWTPAPCPPAERQPRRWSR